MNTVTIDTEQDLPVRLNAIAAIVRRGLPGGPVLVELKRKRRTLDQNAKLWPMLTDVSKQVIWYGERLTKENWKDVFTASLQKQKVVPGIDGGFVMLGVSTRRMSKSEFSDLIELIYAFGSQHEVRWSEPALAIYEKYTA